MDTPICISLPGLVVGPTQLALLDGPTTSNSGRGACPVSHSHLLGKSRVSTIHGTYGPTSFASSVPDGHLSLWESKLRARLATLGSIEWSLTWTVKITPAGRPISRLAASARRTSEIGSGGYPTPTRITDTGGAALCKCGGQGARKRWREIFGSKALNGPLNPDLWRWLMGYPAEWLSCLDSATQLCHNSRRKS